jgi:hypothetical protein
MLHHILRIGFPVRTGASLRDESRARSAPYDT